MSSKPTSGEIAATLAKLAALLAEETRPADIPEQRHRSMPERVLLTVAEAAERLNIGKTKTYALVSAGEIESVLIGRLRRVHIDAVNDYAARLVAQQSARRAA